MPHDSSAAILAGIKTYLDEHFPDADFQEDSDAVTGNIILRAANDTRYALSITPDFLEVDDTPTTQLRWVREWNVARELRYARSRIVTLTLTGVQIA